MYFTALVLLFAANIVMEKHCQDECSDYNVSVHQDGFLFGHDVTIGCRFQGHPNYTTIGFDFRAKYEDTPIQAYTFYWAKHAHLSGPRPPFISTLTGNMTGPKTVIITLLNATELDKLNYFRCLVKTVTCTAAKKATLQLLWGPIPHAGHAGRGRQTYQSYMCGYFRPEGNDLHQRYELHGHLEELCSRWRSKVVRVEPEQRQSNRR